jgi:ADP-heptose:LPS heptosyltransferase
VNEPRRILVIRRDNIGDLVLTTPLIHALRARFPAAWIGVLGNSYNTPVLAGHPDVDAVFAYDKAKHQPQRSRWAVYAQTARLLLRLRSPRIDLAILAGPGAQRQTARFARWLRPRAVLGFVENGVPGNVTLPVPYGDGAQVHEAEDVYRLGAPLGLAPAAGPCVIAADAAQLARFRQAVTALARPGDRMVAVHVSARRVLQRWPPGKFAALVRDLCARGDLTVVLLWAPGAADDPRHPGDDATAAEILAQLPAGARCLPWPTTTLAALSGALAACHLMFCADGGAMHMAAALGVPTVALFGDSPVRRWRPWGVRHEVLQAPSGDVADIEVAEARMACLRLLAPAP